MSDNENVPWTVKLIEEFEEYVCWFSLSNNPSMPWSIEFLEKYIDKWDRESLIYHNLTMWRKVFKPHLNNETINNLLNQLITK